jgi:hypothetical protein
MQGIPVEPQTGVNHIEIIETMLRILGGKVQQGLQQGGMAKPEVLQGLYAIAGYTQQHIMILAEDDQEKPRAKKYADTLGKITNELKGFAQRLQAAMEKQQKQNGNGGLDPKDAAKIQGMQLQAATKAKLATESHAQKTAQRAIAFEEKMHQQKVQHHADLASKDLETASTIRRNRLTSMEE